MDLGHASLVATDSGSRRVLDDFRSIPNGLQLLAAGLVGEYWILMDGIPDAG
jgi:hypothetical protein